METYLSKKARSKERGRKIFNATLALLIVNSVFWFLYWFFHFVPTEEVREFGPRSFSDLIGLFFFCCGVSFLSLYIYTRRLFRLFGIKKQKSKRQKEREDDMDALEQLINKRYIDENSKVRNLVDAINKNCPKCSNGDDTFGCGHVFVGAFVSISEDKKIHCSECDTDWAEASAKWDTVRWAFWKNQLRDLVCYFNGKKNPDNPPIDDFKRFKAATVKKYLWKNREVPGFEPGLAFLSVKELIRYGCRP